jgi:hypothetical protein
MAAQLDDRDRHYLRLAVELSRGFLHDERRWPFGALVVVEDQVVGQGVNQVVELHDPTHTPKCWRCAPPVPAWTGTTSKTACFTQAASRARCARPPVTGHAFPAWCSARQAEVPGRPHRQRSWRLEPRRKEIRVGLQPEARWHYCAEEESRRQGGQGGSRQEVSLGPACPAVTGRRVRRSVPAAGRRGRSGGRTPRSCGQALRAARWCLRLA